MNETLRLNALLRRVLSVMKPSENLTVSQWAEKHRRLSSETAAEPGRWRNVRTPYLRESMDAFNDPKVRRIVMVAASQVGKSEFINNAMGYIIDQDPGSILFVHPTTIDAKDYSKLRIAPMVRDCPTLRTKVAAPKSRDSGNTVLQKTYPGGILTQCGSTEAHALASNAGGIQWRISARHWASSRAGPKAKKTPGGHLGAVLCQVRCRRSFKASWRIWEKFTPASSARVLSQFGMERVFFTARLSFLLRQASVSARTKLTNAGASACGAGLGAGTGAPLSSAWASHISMASWAINKASPISSPSVMQPGKSGKEIKNPPSSASGWKTAG